MGAGLPPFQPVPYLPSARLKVEEPTKEALSTSMSLHSEAQGGGFAS